MNEITLIQGLLIALMGIVVGLDSYLEVLFIFRPIIVCTLTGLILGDLRVGLLAGGLVELSFAGLTPVGGTQPPNPVLAAIMTTVLAHSTGFDVKTTIGLALPFSFLMQYIILFYYSSFSLFVTKFDKYAENADAKKYKQLSNITMIIVSLTYGIVIFLCVYVAQEPMKLLVNSMPEWLTHGFEIAGGILPAVGFGLLLKIMFKFEYLPFLIIGFIMSIFLNFSNLLPVALIGTAIAIYKYYEDIKREKELEQLLSLGLTNEDKEDYSDGI